MNNNVYLHLKKKKTLIIYFSNFAIVYELFSVFNLMNVIYLISNLCHFLPKLCSSIAPATNRWNSLVKQMIHQKCIKKWQCIHQNENVTAMLVKTLYMEWCQSNISNKAWCIISAIIQSVKKRNLINSPDFPVWILDFRSGMNFWILRLFTSQIWDFPFPC